MITGSDADRERQRQVALSTCETEAKNWKKAKTEGNQVKMDEAAVRIPVLMRAAGDAHPDPGVRNKMHEDAKDWENANDEEREKKLHPFLHGLALLLAIPFLAAGGIIWSAGQLIRGIGMGLASGPEFVWKKWRRRG